MLVIGYRAETAWVFPAIIDTAVAVSTMILVALGDKPARRTRTVNTSSDTAVARMGRDGSGALQGAKSQVKPAVPHRRPAVAVRNATRTDTVAADADLAAELIASRVTTQPSGTVIAVLIASREGATINAAAKKLKIKYRTTQRIVEAAEARRRDGLLVAS
jgi:hypothetical protein